MPVIDVDALEEGIYEAAIFPEAWPKLLDQLARSINAEGALLANMSSAKLPWLSSQGVSELYEDFFHRWLELRKRAQ